MSHPNPKFGQVKCVRHADAHCYECYPVKFEPESTSAPAPVEQTKSHQVDQPQKVEPDSHPLVTASLEFAKASEVYRKAVEFVRDCEKRLEFAKGEVLEASEEKSKAFEKVRALIGENHD